jgi:hypothetical protein
MPPFPITNFIVSVLYNVLLTVHTFV